MKQVHFSFLFYILLFTAVVLPKNVLSQSQQGFINYSTYLGGGGSDNVISTKVVNGETYVLGTTTSANFPVTNGSVYSGGNDGTITKLDSSGKIIYSTYIGGNGDDNFIYMAIVNGAVYLTGTTTSSNYPVTNGSTYGGNGDVMITKLNTTGSIIFSSYIGGSENENLTSYDFFNTGINGFFQIVNNNIYISGNTSSPNFPVVNGRANKDSIDGFIIKLDTSGNIIFSTCLGGSLADQIGAMQIDNNEIYVLGITTSSDFPVTNGSSITAGTGASVGFITKLDGNGNVVFSEYVGEDNSFLLSGMLVDNGIVYICGATSSPDYPVTNESNRQQALLGGFITSLNSSGNVIYSSYVNAGDSGELVSFPFTMAVVNNEVYLEVNYGTSTIANTLITKLNAAGETTFTSDAFPIGSLAEMKIINGETYLAGTVASSKYPVTNGSAYGNSTSGVFTKLNTNGTTAFSSYLGQMGSLNDLQITGDKVYIAGITSSATNPSTNGSTVSGGNDDIIIILNDDGSTYFTGYLGGTYTESNIGLQIDSGAVYISGQTNSSDYPVTDSSRYKQNNDIYVTKLEFCPFNYDVANDTLSPSVQTTCKLGLGIIITGKPIVIDSSSAATILYRNGIAQKQTNTEATYQWQTANSTGGPWSNITSANSINYIPTGGSVTEYYRRLAYTLPDCGIPVTDTSSIATVFVNANIAPVINAGGLLLTCPGTPVTIGGSPTATGGNPPYKYSWNTGDSIANPIVTLNTSAIYTLAVTDTLGCEQLGQALVNVYKAGAGADQSNCAGVAVRIGSSPAVNTPGVIYNWSPATGLSDSTQAQPFANPTDSTLYILTVTLPVAGSGTCVTSDSVNIVPVATAPAPNFAGPDHVICLGDSVTLGTSTAVPGYTYTWAPGSYLETNNASTATFYAGNTIMPVPNPGTITVTAQKEGCTFTDQTEVAVIEARAGLSDICGPRIIGMPDRTPNINTTYLWGKSSGSGNFVFPGATDQPQVLVSASTTSATNYTLLVIDTADGGGYCSSSVTVPVCGGDGDCLTYIDVTAKYGCPSYTLNGGNVSLSVDGPNNNFIYTWSPTAGLSDSVGSTVSLTDNVPRTYTLTATSIYDSTDHCSRQITVNDPAWSVPVFKAKDTTICSGTSVNIGQAYVAGYTYSWNGYDYGLTISGTSNPTVTLSNPALIPVTVTDTTSGCYIRDTADIKVQPVIKANAGGNQTVCSNAIVTLGTPSQAGVTYYWVPSSSPWQNGTDSSSAQPQVLVATSSLFYLIASSPTGCAQIDFANITVTSTPTIPDAPDTIYCKGSAGVTIGSPALPNVSYVWSPAAGLSNSNIAQPVASPTVTTIYSVIATFPGSCSSVATDQVTVTVSDPSFTLPDINYCPNAGAIVLGASAPAGMQSYVWSPANLVSDDSIANPTTLTPPPTSPTTYTLTVTNGDGCTAKNTTTIYPMTNPPIAGIDRGLCLNSSTTLGSNTNDTSANITYSWSPATNLDNSTSITPVFTPTSAGTYIYTITKTDNSIGCSNSDTVTITVNDLSLPAITSPSICQNSCVQIGTTPAAGVTYSWSPASGLSNAAIANPIACAGTTTTTYTLTATSASGCSATTNVSVIVAPVPAPLISIPTVTTCLGTNDVTFNPTITPAGTYSYLWSPNDGTLNNIYSDTPRILLTSTSNKQYSLTVTDSVTGCSSTATANLITNACSVLASVGDYVWFDLNEDGIQDTNEPGVSGATVTLYNSLGFAVASSITDASGHYLINNVQPDTGYYIIFSRPSGYTFTLQNIGGITAIDNSKPDATGKTNSFDLSANENLTSIDAGVKSIGTVLPITLVSFTGSLQNNVVVLNWQTSAEFNNSYFNIERSTDGIHFVVIGKVMGNGTSSIPHSYVYTDTQPLDGTSFYRLVQVDYDGQGTYSDIIVITNNKQQVVNAYYNSQLNTIMITFKTLQTGNVQFNLFADDGQLMKSLSAENILTQQLNTQGLAKGIYLLQIAGNTVNYAQKIFVQ